MSVNLIPATIKQKIDKALSKYPQDKKKSAIKTALFLLQKHNHGWLNVELIDAAAEYLEILPVEAYEVATFYNMFDLKPQGKYKISVCTNVSCMLRGANDLLTYLKDKYDLSPDKVSADNRFSLKEVECLAACGGAPAVMVDCNYHYEVDVNNIEEVLAAYD